MTAAQIIKKYISFFEKRGHRRIVNSPLVLQNDPTTLFTSSGMQPLVPYLLGEPHPQGKRLVNVQNCFRAQDIDEVGDNRHTTFFRMLGNWSLGDYFKNEQLPWFFEFLTQELRLDPNRLYVTIFGGDNRFRIIENEKPQRMSPDLEAADIWTNIFEKVGVKARIANISTRDIERPNINKGRIFYYRADKNWWSRSGAPEQMPIGEIGGPDSEVFYDFGEGLKLHESSQYKTEPCHHNCQCGRFLEIGNSVFMQYKKIDDSTFEELPNKNVDFGGGLERLLAVLENQQDVFQTSLFSSIVRTIELLTKKNYKQWSKNKNIRIVIDHIVASIFIIDAGIVPSNKEQGYVLRRLIRRGLDNFYNLGGSDLSPVIESIVEQYKDTNPNLATRFEKIKYTIFEEEKTYKKTLKSARTLIAKKYAHKIGDELMGVIEISADDAFQLYSSHGLSPTQIKSLGYAFDEQEFAEKMKQHQAISRIGSEKKFAGGLADHSEKTIRGHTATHLLHQTLRDVLGNHVFQTGSNITSKRLRFDFNYDKNLTDEQLNKVEKIVSQKIRANLPVHFEMLPLKKAKEIGAIGLFDEKYEQTVKVYFIGPKTKDSPRASLAARRGEAGQRPYSVEFCGGPHVEETSKVGKFSIIKQENIGKGIRRIYAKVN